LAAEGFASVFFTARVAVADFVAELGLDEPLGLVNALDFFARCGFESTGFAGPFPPFAAAVFFAGWLARPRTGAAFFVFFVAMLSIVRRIAQPTRALERRSFDEARFRAAVPPGLRRLAAGASLAKIPGSS
jgi:hypothetical protein